MKSTVPWTTQDLDLLKLQLKLLQESTGHLLFHLKGLAATTCTHQWLQIRNYAKLVMSILLSCFCSKVHEQHIFMDLSSILKEFLKKHTYILVMLHKYRPGCY